MSRLTIANIREPDRASGFKYVAFAGEANVGQYKKPYQAKIRVAAGLGSGTFWHGPRRATAFEAAQDAVDYQNNAKASLRRFTLKSAGHKRPQRRPVACDPHADRKRALRAEIRRLEREVAEERQGYVYLAIEIGGGLVYGKIGYTTDLQGRIASLQTGNPRPLRMHLAKPGTEADEAALHAKYHKDNVLQEWFLITGELLLEWDAEHYVSIPSDRKAKVA